MSSATPFQKSVLRGAVGITNHIAPLKQKKEPVVAAVLGFVFGGIGLAIYFGSLLDFILPIAIWIGCVIVAFPTGGLGLVLAPLFTAAYGYSRAKSSNAKLDALQNHDRIIDIQEVSDSPAITAPAATTIETRLMNLNGLFDRHLISQTEYDAKRQQILADI